VKRHALVVGRDVYETANPLEKCVADARAWSGYLTGRGYTVTELLDEDATRATILSNLYGLAEAAYPGDQIVFTYSGHGTRVPTSALWEEPDGYDEALYPDEVLLDDDLRDALDAFVAGVFVTVVLDSCHSGTGTRALVDGPRARFHRLPEDPGGFAVPIVNLLGRRGLRRTEALWAACRARELSYEGPLQGAFTAAVLAALTPGLTLRESHREVRRRLPSDDFPQHPQLEGRRGMLDSVAFP
jgi:hypothetical protein